MSICARLLPCQLLGLQLFAGPFLLTTMQHKPHHHLRYLTPPVPAPLPHVSLPQDHLGLLLFVPSSFLLSSGPLLTSPRLLVPSSCLLSSGPSPTTLFWPTNVPALIQFNDLICVNYTAVYAPSFPSSCLLSSGPPPICVRHVEVCIPSFVLTLQYFSALMAL